MQQRSPHSRSSSPIDQRGNSGCCVGVGLGHEVAVLVIGEAHRGVPKPLRDHEGVLAVLACGNQMGRMRMAEIVKTETLYGHFGFQQGVMVASRSQLGRPA